MRAKELSCLLVALLTWSARGQTNAAKIHSISLRDCISQALQHNLDVQIVRRDPDIARFKLGAARGTQYDPIFTFGAERRYVDVPANFDLKKVNPYNPYTETEDVFGGGLSGRLTPGLSYRLFASSTAVSAFTDFTGLPVPKTGLPVPNRFTNNYEAMLTLNLKQSLLKDFWIDAGRLAIQVNKKNLKISEQELRLQIMKTVLAVQTAYFDLDYAGRIVQVMQKGLELAEELLAGDRQRIEIGRLPPLSERQAESEVETARASLLTAQDALDTRRDALLNLMSDDLAGSGKEILVPADTLDVRWEKPSLTESLLHAMTLRPDLLLAKLEVEKQGIVVRYQYNQMFPALDLEGSYGGLSVEAASQAATFSDLGNRLHPTYTAGVVLKIPLSNTAARNQYKASKEIKEQTLLNLKKVEQNVYLQVLDVVKSLERHQQRMNATRKARAYAESAFEAEKQKLLDGRSTSFLVSEYENRLIAAQAAEILAMVDYNKAEAQLAFNDGTTLKKNQITLDLR